MTYPTISYLDFEGNLSEECQHQIPTETLVKGYRTMVTSRVIDERMITLQRQGLISFAISAYGEEAAIVGSAAALENDDWLYPQYREAGIIHWRGFTTEQYLHTMFCNAKDMGKGRQMPNHFGSRELNVVTVSSPIATAIPHAAGCAYAMKLQGEKNIAVAYFGDGATSEGDFHGGLNFAAVRKAPAIFFCRNNGYAISTPVEDQYVSDGIAPKGVGYGMKTFRVDGNDFFAVHEVTTQAREHCLNGKGPVLIEAMTHRLGPHSTSDDPTAYRSDEELKPWLEKDPLPRLRLYLEKQGLWTAQQEEALHAELKSSIDEAIKVAKATPKPPIESLVEDVYFEVPAKLKEQLEEIKLFFPGE